MLKKIITNILISLMTEEVFKEVIVLGLYKFAGSTDNTVDDHLARVVDKALNKNSRSE